MKVLVLGSNSFSGSWFVDHALGEGADVVGVSRSEEAHSVFLPYRHRGKDCLSRFRFHRSDINRDLESLMTIVREFRPAYFVNFAAQSMVAESWHNPDHWMTTNVVATIRLHERLRNCDFLERYVHVSTPEVYGSCATTLKENTDYHPSTPYAVSRAAADMSLMTFFQNYRFPIVLTRAANVYGPGQQLYRIIPKTILSLLTGRKIPLHGGGISVRSFIHVRDVVDGTWRASLRSPPGEIYHLATSRSISIRALVEMIASSIGLSFDDHVDIAPERPGKDLAYLLDATKAGERLGWKATIDLEQGIDETIRWVRENLDVLRNMPMEYVHKP